MGILLLIRKNDLLDIIFKMDQNHLLHNHKKILDYIFQ